MPQLILRREPHVLKADVTLSSKGALKIIVFTVELMCILHVCICVYMVKNAHDCDIFIKCMLFYGQIFFMTK